MTGMAPTGRALVVWALCATLALVALSAIRVAEPTSISTLPASLHRPEVP